MTEISGVHPISIRLRPQYLPVRSIGAQPRRRSIFASLPNGWWAEPSPPNISQDEPSTQPPQTVWSRLARQPSGLGVLASPPPVVSQDLSPSTTIPRLLVCSPRPGARRPVEGRTEYRQDSREYEDRFLRGRRTVFCGVGALEHPRNLPATSKMINFSAGSTEQR